ncbi:uncharacterized protein LOC100901131 [Galendromus occidentalis]|uniref:Uncharacterized protein LOC100901131 n=1 Tax=Galendromus occidentalis TaxID=34638 RepID=A0AAJ7PAF0_9ACAR|nr:uncharacterized protein LOC100901131 [Galendromus occidentalis]
MTLFKLSVLLLRTAVESRALSQWTIQRRFRSTIFALSTAYVKSAVAVFRVSGPEAARVMSLIGNIESPEHRRAYVRRLRHPVTSKIIDSGVMLWFKGPSSFTGEDVCELQCHGSIAVIKTLSSALASIDGLRMAEPGEFAKRAFHNRKLDLSDAESLADLIDAETESQLDQAIRGSQLSGVCNQWMSQIKEAMANFEAYIDFSEDQDIPAEEVVKNVRSTLRNTLLEIRLALQSAPRGHAIRTGFRVAITGRPNVGKSTLMNILSQQETSIVSPSAGTTRDLVKTTLDLGGLPIVLCDTAGIRSDTDDAVELEGITRAKDFAENAHINVSVIDDPASLARDRGEVANEDTIVVLNKIDLLRGCTRQPGIDYAVSCATGAGIAELTDGIISRLRSKYAPDAPPLIVRERQQELIQSALENIEMCLADELCADAVISAEFLRRAAMDLGRITGRVETEDILDIIFSRFCIGK